MLMSMYINTARHTLHCALPRKGEREGGRRVVNGAQNGKLRSETGPGTLPPPNFLIRDSTKINGDQNVVTTSEEKKAP